MDEWSYHTPDADEITATQTAKLQEDSRVIDVHRARTEQVKAAHGTKLELADLPPDFHGPRLDEAAPLLFATPRGAAPTS